MKTTNVTFQDRVPHTCLIVKESVASKCRQIITGAGKGTIIKEYTPKERGDDKYCFEIENIVYHLLLFFKDATDEYSVVSYVLSYNESIRMDFSIDDSRRVESIRVLFKGDTKSGGIDWSNLVNVRSRKELLAKDLSRYEVSWSSIGAISVDDAREFATGLNVAVTLAQECTEQFIPSRSNPIAM